MHRGLPLVTSIELVDFDSSESTFGTSVNSIMLVWLQKYSRLVPGQVRTFRQLAIIFLYAMQWLELVKCLSIAFLHYKLLSNKVNI